MMGYYVNTGKLVVIGVAALALAACQRPAADASSVPYKIIEDGAGRTACLLCVVPLPQTECVDGEAAAVRWAIPGDQAAGVSVQILRKDGAREELASGGASGEAPLRVSLMRGDRVVVQSSETGRDLFFTRVRQPVGCALQR